METQTDVFNKQKRQYCDEESVEQLCSPKRFKQDDEMQHSQQDNISQIDENTENSSLPMRADEGQYAKTKKGKKLSKKEKENEDLNIQKSKREQSYRALKYLLNKSSVYSKYIEERMSNNMQNVKTKNHSATQPDIDLAQIRNSSNEQARAMNISLLENGKLRDYQLEGVEWLKVLYENGVNGILADEMGLGKTIQTIAFICHLYNEGVRGPFLICAPLSTLPNWSSEFKRFAPKLPVVLFHGDKETRKSLVSSILKKKYIVGDKTQCRPVVLTSYQTPLTEQAIMSVPTWSYIIIDEGHRLKSHKTQLYRVLQSFKSMNRLLLTGTPLQNNLRELWSLLHFLLPEIFTDFEIFEAWLDVDDLKNDADKFIKQEQETRALSMMHDILKPFVLRRLKTDVALSLPPKKELIVYCPLSVKQRDLYKYVVDRNIEELANPGKKEFEILPEKRPTKARTSNFFKECESDDEFDFYEDVLNLPSSFTDIPKKVIRELVRITMQNTAMMFRKIVNHPYLVHFPLEKECIQGETPVLRIDEELVTQSGKMMMLDALSSRLIAGGHKILIFSTLTMMLDIIEEFVIMRGYDYRRLDGGKSFEQRSEAIQEFNTDPEVKIFLLSTRAGGQGLNLTAADTVILYDSDWNPQVDIQAQDRCHRIGQTKPVIIYQFVTRGTIDEVIISVGEKKRKLEKLIIQTDKFKLVGKKLQITEKAELENLKKLLTEDEKVVVTSGESVISSEELDKLLDRSDLLLNINNNKK